MQDEETLKSHEVFDDLVYLREFYNHLSTSVFQWCRSGVNAIGNIDSYLYSSAAGTIDSISLVLGNARIADAYALLRRFYDSAILNVYIDELSDKWKSSLSSDLNAFKWQEEIEGWMKGDTSLPEFRIMSQVIRQSKRLAPLNSILYADDRYKLLRDRCNSHTHFNYYRNVLVNDNEIHLPQRSNLFAKFRFDIIDVALLHMTYVYQAMPHYLMSSDYMDCRECGMEPEEGAEYWVAPFLQEFFDKYFKTRRSDLAQQILANSSMQLS